MVASFFCSPTSPLGLCLQALVGAARSESNGTVRRAYAGATAALVRYAPDARVGKLVAEAVEMYTQVRALCPDPQTSPSQCPSPWSSPCYMPDLQARPASSLIAFGFADGSLGLSYCARRVPALLRCVLGVES